MQAWSMFWRGMSVRPVRQAWGLASHGPSWSLVGLNLLTPELISVHTSIQWSPSQEETVWPGLGKCLREAGALRGRQQHRVSMALSSEQCVSGVLELPAHLAADEWATEVQLEVSQLLGKPADEVHFDFYPEIQTHEAVQRVHWVGCTQTQIDDYKICTRAAGWQLESVEPAVLAAQRAVAALQGGMGSVLTQSTQDWQFRVQSVKELAAQMQGHPLDLMAEPGLHQAMKSEAGARLMAAGLALRVWL